MLFDTTKRLLQIASVQHWVNVSCLLGVSYRSCNVFSCQLHNMDEFVHGSCRTTPHENHSIIFTGIHTRSNHFSARNTLSSVKDITTYGKSTVAFQTNLENILGALLDIYIMCLSRP